MTYFHIRRYCPRYYSDCEKVYSKTLEEAYKAAVSESLNDPDFHVHLFVQHGFERTLIADLLNGKEVKNP